MFHVDVALNFLLSRNASKEFSDSFSQTSFSALQPSWQNVSNAEV